MKKSSLAIVFAACALLASPIAFADDDGGKDAAKESKGDDFARLPAFPADRTVRQQTTIDGRSLAYDATVGSLPVLDEKGKTTAEVMFIAYTVPGKDRPVTFALNGGPGASSVYLNLGALGPKRVQFGAEGNSPSD
ncbi:MAG TPA: peptidase S10, partial [Dokdonella sp.]|nr:peptidase S10 [Dokdonella sp.]